MAEPPMLQVERKLLLDAGWRRESSPPSHLHRPRYCDREDPSCRDRPGAPRRRGGPLQQPDLSGRVCRSRSRSRWHPRSSHRVSIESTRSGPARDPPPEMSLPRAGPSPRSSPGTELDERSGVPVVISHRIQLLDTPSRCCLRTLLLRSDGSERAEVLPRTGPLPRRPPLNEKQRRREVCGDEPLVVRGSESHPRWLHPAPIELPAVARFDLRSPDEGSSPRQIAPVHESAVPLPASNQHHLHLHSPSVDHESLRVDGSQSLIACPMRPMP